MFRACSATCEFTDFEKEDNHEVAERESVRRKLMTAMTLSFFFMMVEVAGGILSNSLAILTDAAHLLSDIAGFAVSIFAIWMAGKQATPSHTFGYLRSEILGALISMLIIWAITAVLVYEAILRCISMTQEVDGKLMFLTASIGVCVNILMTVILGPEHHHHGHDDDDDDHHGHGDGHGHGHKHDHEHDHDHDHDHDHKLHRHPNKHVHEPVRTVSTVSTAPNQQVITIEDGKKDTEKGSDVEGGKKDHSHDTPLSDENINLRGAYLHVIGDLIQSIGVMIGGAFIWYNPKWKIVDLICTFFFSIVVLSTTLRMLRDVLEVLMEGTPREVDAVELEDGLKKLPNVLDVHELHIWAITKGKIVLACHVQTTPEAENVTVLNSVMQFCEKNYGITHVTVQVEHATES